MPQRFALFARLFKHPTRPAGDRANADLAHARMLELEDESPSPLLLNLATGFPSALLCVLAAGVLAGALAGRQVGQPLHTIGAVRAGPAAAVAAAPTAATPAEPAFAVAPRDRAQTSALATRAAQKARLEALELQALAQLPARALQPPSGDGRPR